MDTYSWALPITVSFQRNFSFNWKQFQGYSIHVHSVYKRLCWTCKSNMKDRYQACSLSTCPVTPTWNHVIIFSYFVENWMVHNLHHSSRQCQLNKVVKVQVILNSLSVGLLLVSICNKRTPKLYTSPLVESWLPIPYSAKI